MTRRILLPLAAVLLPAILWAQAAPTAVFPSRQPPAESDWSLKSPVIWDDFCGGNSSSGNIGSLHWSFTSGGSVSSWGFADLPGRPCAGQFALIATGTGGVFNPYTFGFSLQDIGTLVLHAMVPTAANLPDAWVGTTGSNSNAAPNAASVYFEKLAADTNWWAVVRDGAGAGGQTRFDTGLPWSPGTYNEFEIRHPASGRWDFYIDGIARVSASTGHIPAETAPVVFIVQAATHGTAVTIGFDYFRLHPRTNR